MSTLDTHMNLGASYIVNDFYRPFICKGKSERHYLMISRVLTFFLITLTLVVSTQLTSILGAYKYLSVVYGGTGTVMIARWYWWRVNPWSEISAIVASLIIANGLHFLINDKELFAVQLVVTVVSVSLVWIIVTLITSSQKPSSHLLQFYTKMKLPGHGWAKVRREAGIVEESNELRRSFWGWMNCIIFIYSATIGLGKLLLHEYYVSCVCFLISCVSVVSLYRLLRLADFLSLDVPCLVNAVCIQHQPVVFT